MVVGAGPRLYLVRVGPAPVLGRLPVYSRLFGSGWDRRTLDRTVGTARTSVTIKYRPQFRNEEAHCEAALAPGLHGRLGSGSLTMTDLKCGWTDETLA
jgi:hypothetical protein